MTDGTGIAEVIAAREAARERCAAQDRRLTVASAAVLILLLSLIGWAAVWGGIGALSMIPR